MMNFQLAREEMVDQIEEKGVSDPLVLAAMRETRRHEFVPRELQHRAYEDGPLAIGEGQTISQPYIVARMTELLEITGRDRVLEIGTGSGYQTAVLSKLAQKVFTIERITSLANRAKTIFEELELNNIVQKVGDGSMGWSEFAPYDAILVTAGAPAIPDRLVAQLADGGRLVIPTGPRRVQDLKKIVKREGEPLTTVSMGGCVFVPLIGSDGWSS